MNTYRKYGCNPDTHKANKFLFDHRTLGLPTNDIVDNSSYIHWVYDQLDEGSCTANSGLSTERFYRSTHGLPDFDGSRQFLYYVTRDSEGNADNDSGASIADTVLAEMTTGVCLESTWQYSQPLTARPSQSAYDEAANYKVISRQPIEQTQEAIETCLSNKLPVHFGISVYQSFESPVVSKTGIVPMPIRLDKFVGGHAIWLHSYNRILRKFFAQNSWGSSFGQGGKGIFELDYDYVLSTNLSQDFWTITV